MPLRWVKARPKKPGESLVDYTGPRLDEEFVAGPSGPSPALVAVSPLARLEIEMTKRGWMRDLTFEKVEAYKNGNTKAWVNQSGPEESWTAYYNEYDEKGNLVQDTESKSIAPDRPDVAVDELLKMVDDESHRKKLREFWAKLRAPPPEPTKTIEEAIKESLTVTFKGNEVTTENLQAQLSAYNIQVTDEELEKVLSDTMGVVQTGRHTWTYQRPVDYSKWEQEPEE